ncbi:hypothetical protein C1646_770387 [Rhizophagus diaphanus]|nr:hypothetical protein C1646_770387 [Rhizophagus diaphanus] [Rhizophagus sp. MUCL 43196]
MSSVKIPAKKLHKSLIECFLDNDYNPSVKLGSKITKENTIRESIDSKTITIQCAKLISKWIDKLGIVNEVKNLYEFKLILCGSRPKTFHEICDNQSHTVTYIKVKDSNEILGGYNPIE